jgi:nucleoside-diphosphate-sugar epimerase
MAKYLITGGAGFIGGHLGSELVARGHQVRILDNFSTGKRQNLAGILERIELIEGDLREVSTITAALKGMDGVFHQGALASVPRSIREPLLTHQCNLTATLTLLIAARECGVKRVVMASSSSVYGNSASLPKVESMPLNPLSPYALQKAAAELYVRLFYPLYGLETIALRYFNIFGPRQDPESEYAAVVPRFATRMLRGESPLIYGDGTQSRDFTYVENAVAANIAAIEAPVSACGQVYNIGCGERFSLNDLVSGINAILGTNIQPRYEPGRSGDVKHSLAEIQAAKDHLGYVPQVSFQEGLLRTVEWFKAKPA